jgi:hypothetical protein
MIFVGRLSIACALASAAMGCSDDLREHMRQQSETTEMAHLQRFNQESEPRRRGRCLNVGFASA